MKTSLAGIAAGLLLFSACNLSVPESFSVKTNANYNYSIGNISQDFSESFKASNLFSGLETDHNKIYDYFPGQEDDKLQQYLLTIKVDPVTLPSATVPAGVPISLVIPTITVDFNISEVFESIKEILGESFVENADFREVSLYVYCGKPAGFEPSELSGSVTMKYVADDGSNTSATDVTIGGPTNVIPYFSAPELEIINIDKSENVVVSVVKPEEASMYGDIKKILNGNKKKAGKITLDFNLGFSGITDGKPIGTLALTAFMVIPFKFDISGVIDISLMLIFLTAMKQQIQRKYENILM